MLRLVLSSVLSLHVGVGTALADAPVQRQDVSIEYAWARATPPGVQVGAAYAVIRNNGEADRLLAIETLVSERVEIHNTAQVEGRMQMRQVTTLDVPAHGRVTFEPGGLHLMLVDLKQPLLAGEQLSLIFVFAKAGRIAAQASIAPIGSTQAPAQNTSHDAHH